MSIHVSRAQIGMAMALLVMAGCARSAAPEPAKAPPPLQVRVGTIKRGQATRSISLPAGVVPYQQAVLFAKVSGYAKAITVDKGDHVQAGQLLAEIEVPELLADRSKYQAELEVARLEHQRIAEARKKAPDLVVAQEVDTARSREQIAQANLERTQTLLGFCRITAPFDGIITERRIDPGAFVPAATAGSSGAHNGLLTIMDFTRVRIQAAVPEMEVPFIKNGLGAVVTVEELPRSSFEGQITRFSHALEENTRTMLTEIELPNPDGQLRPGMYARVRLILETKPDALIAPTEALLTEKTRTSVFTVADNKAKRVTVRTGFNDAGAVEILEGVEINAPVILFGKQPPGDGQPIIVTPTR